MKNVMPSGRVVVVGAGMVGSSIAYSLLNQEITKEILIMDIAEELAKANVLDMNDASSFTNGTKVEFANYSHIKDGDIVVITCGAAQKEGQTRLDLLNINAKIIKDVIGKIKATKKMVFIIMVTNPVDVLTYIAVEESGLPKGMVFGSGTYLDSMRLRIEISKEIGVNTDDVSAYIMGEHGDSSFPLLSNANIGGIPLTNFMKIDSKHYKVLEEKVRHKAYEIINGKKATYYGIGTDIAKICRCIIRNEERIMPLSVKLDGEYGVKDVTIGVPAKLSSEGVKVIGEVSFSEEEKANFINSVQVIKDNIAKIG